MDSKISNLIELSYSKGKYQGVFLLFCFLTWLNCNIFHVTIHKLEYFPIIYSDPPSTEKYEDYDSNICTKLEKNETFYIMYYKTYKYSIVADLESECDYIGNFMLSASPYAGSVIGPIIFIFTSQKFTYKSVIFANANLMIITLVMITLFNNIYAISVFIMLFSIQVTLVCCATYLLGIEIASKKRRALFTTIVYIGLPFSGLFYNFLFMSLYELYWKGVIGICIFMAGIIDLFYYFFTFESPRNLLKMKRINEAFDSLGGIAKFNGVEKEFNKLMNTHEYKKFFQSLEDNTNILYSSINENNTGIKGIIKSKSTKKTFLIFCLLWLFANLQDKEVHSPLIKLYQLYYDLLSYTFQIIGIIIIGILVNIKCLGRKKPLIFAFFCFSITYVICVFIFDKTENEMNFWLFLILLLSNLFYQGGRALVYLFSIESYPTSMRSTAFGLNVLCGALGNIIGLCMQKLEELHQGIVFCVFGISTGLLAILLKETYDLQIEDVENETIEEMVNSSLVAPDK